MNADSDINVLAFADASYGIHSDGKSHSGLVITLGEGPIFVKSSKQKIVTKSTYEAELVSASDAGSQIMWSRDFLLAQGYEVKEAILYQDNQATMKTLIDGRSSTERSRHIRVRYFWLHGEIQAKRLKVKYKDSKSMIADILTKPLQGEMFIKLRAKLLNWYASTVT